MYSYFLYFVFTLKRLCNTKQRIMCKKFLFQQQPNLLTKNEFKNQKLFQRFENTRVHNKRPKFNLLSQRFLYFPPGIYLLKVNNKNTRKRCEICSKLTVKITIIFIVNFEHILHIFLMFLLLTLNMQLPAGLLVCVTI